MIDLLSLSFEDLFVQKETCIGLVWKRQRGDAIMQLKITTDYAVRITLYLAAKKRMITSHELSEVLCIPQSMVLKIGKRLHDAEIVTVSTGVQGGFSLRKKDTEISLMDIIKTMESTIKINRCLEEDEFCSRGAVSYCTVRQTYGKIQDDLEKRLSEITIHDLMK